MTEDPIDELLAACLDMPPSDRRRCIDEQCRSRPEWAGELRRRYRRMVELGMVEAPADGLETLGPYRLLRRLGRGGMGVVWLAEDAELGREVALKLIRPEFLDSAKARARFQREVAAAAKLDDPGLCTVYGAGEIDGQPFLALRYLRGGTLEDQLRAARASDRGAWGGQSESSDPGHSTGRLRPTDLRPALLLVERLARSLHTAHEAGLVHRDVKPGNVMVTKDGTPVLMDFGLVLDAEHSHAPLTQTHDVVGTPAYMAPEQIRGETADRRTDVYALGAVLYDCLTLRQPFVGRNREELYRSILQTECLDVRRLQPAASRDLSTVVHKALAREPHHRYATAEQLAGDLRAVLDGRPTVARPPGPLRRGLGWVRRNRAAAAFGVAVLAGLLSSLVLLGRSRTAERRSFAVAEVTRAWALRDAPERAIETLRAAFAVAPEPEVVGMLNQLLPELQEWDLVAEPGVRLEGLVSSPSGRWHLVGGTQRPASLHGRDGAWIADLDGPTSQSPVAAFSPDERQLLVAHGNRLVHYALSDSGVAATATPSLPERSTPPGPAVSIAWNAEGPVLVFRGTDQSMTNSAVVFDSYGAPGASIPVPAGQQGCAFLPDGSLVLPDGVYDRQGDRLRPFPGSDSWEPPLQIAASGSKIVLGSWSGVRILHADDTLEDHRRPAPELGAQFKSLETAADGAVLVTFNDGTVQLIDPAGRAQTWQEPRTVWRASFSPDGDRILAPTWGGQVVVRDRRGNLLHRWQGHQAGTVATWLHDGSNRVLTASWDGTIKRWRPGSVPGLPFRSGFARARVASLEDVLVVATSDGRLLTLDADGKVVRRSRVPPGYTLLHRHAEAPKVWISRFLGPAIRSWDHRSDTFGPPIDLGRERGPLSIAHLAPDRLLFGRGWRSAVQEHLLSENATRTDERWPTMFSAASQGGHRAITIDGYGLLRIHGGASTTEHQVPRPATGNRRAPKASCLALSASGDRAAIGRIDGSLHLWDLDPRTSEIRRPHQETVRDVALSPDGRHIASVTAGGHLVVATTTSEQPLLEAHLEDESLESVAFFADAVVTTGWRGSGRLRWWWWDPEKLAARLKRIPQRD